MKYLKQRVPLGTLQPDGKTVQITREFGDEIEKAVATLLGAMVTNTVTGINPASFAALTAAINDLTKRVKALEDGYQS